MSEPLRLGLVGCGRIASAGYAPAIAARPELDLVALADPVGERRREVARAAAAPGATEHGDVEALVAAADLDALVVAGPASSHLEAATAAAMAGLACLVEKPPAPDLAGAEALARLEPAPWIGFNRRFWQGEELRPRIRPRGPLELELELRYRRSSWRSHEVSDEALLDLAPHLVDLAAHLAGGPLRLRAARVERERCELELETARGSARIRCATDRAHSERVEARGEGWRARSVSGGLGGAVAGRLRRGPHPLARSLGRQLDAFARRGARRRSLGRSPGLARAPR